MMPFMASESRNSDKPGALSERRTGATGVLSAVLVLNLSVAIAKLVTGTMTASIAILADGYHSLFDSLATVVGILGVTAASRPPDADHPPPRSPGDDPPSHQMSRRRASSSSRRTSR